jgi:hypothetical protein
MNKKGRKKEGRKEGKKKGKGKEKEKEKEKGHESSGRWSFREEFSPFSFLINCNANLLARVDAVLVNRGHAQRRELGSLTPEHWNTSGPGDMLISGRIPMKIKKSLH